MYFLFTFFDVHYAITYITTNGHQYNNIGRIYQKKTYLVIEDKLPLIFLQYESELLLRKF